MVDTKELKTRAGLEPYQRYLDVDLPNKRHITCPFQDHEDKNPSFRVEQYNGSYRHICTCGQGDCIDFLCKIEGKDKGTVIRDLKERYMAGEQQSPSKKDTPLRKHTYDSAIPQYQKHILQKTSKRKYAVYWTQDKEGIFSIKGLKSERVWYNQKALKKSGHVFVVEGEKDSDTITKHGYIAITSGGVSDTPTPEMLNLLTGRDIVIIPDNDNQGKKYAQKLSGLFEDIAKSIRIVEITQVWSEAHEKSDISDMPEDLRISFLKGIIAGKSFKSETEETHKKDTDIFPVCPFPHQVIPKEIRELCEDLAEVYQVDIEAVYTIMLPVISGSIGNSIKVFANREWVQPVFLQNVLVEYSGRGKSPIQRFFIKPIYEKQDTEFQKHQEAMKQYKIDCRIAKDNDEPEPDKPICKRYTSNNTTVEALVNIQKDNQRGIILDIDEFSGHVKSHNQYKGKGNDKEYWLTSFNNAPYIVDRKGHEPINCKYTGMSIIAGIQPGELKRLFSSKEFYDTGYVARYNFYIHSDKTKRYSTKSREIRNKQVWASVIEYCHNLETINDNDDIFQRAIHFSQEAQELFIDYCNSLEDCYRYLSDNAKPFIGKTQLYFSRYAGIVHVLDCFFNKKDILSDITQETAQKAKKLCEFYLSQAMIMLELYQDKEELSGQDKKLIEALKGVESEVKAGKVLLSSVVKAYNQGLSENLQIKSNKAMSGMLKSEKFQLEVVSGTGNKSCLFWDSQKIEKLFSKLP